ncbi:MAG: polyprenyl synthetase family protein [Firmicutes bacterium]|nr:polyprenyl synthetase family protein [Bacillota bacterium]MBQ2227631.1 polyprenyl synthetase family protein [Bacillota bacterium]
MNSPEFNRLKNLINDHILDYMPVIDQKVSTLYDSMRYSLTAGGKRIRPVLMMAAGLMCGEKEEFLLPFACAAEFIQTYSLIHDDLPAMDNDDYRRGMLTNHKVYGEDIAILAGDALLSASYEVMSKQMLLFLDDEDRLKRLTRALFELTKGTGVRGMVAGQVADVENEGKACSEEMLTFIHANKTAAFIKSVTLAGGYLGGADEQLLSDLRTYGEHVGLAFQIVDDILDIIGDEKTLGKKTHVDAQLDKATFPALYGLEKSVELAMGHLAKARDAMEKYYDEAEVFNYIIDFLESEIIQ